MEVMPRLFPFKISCKKPVKNKIILDGLIFNLTMHKYIVIEIKLGVEVLNIEKKLKDVWKFIIKNKKTNINILFENL